MNWEKGGRGLAANDASLGNSGKQGANVARMVCLKERDKICEQRLTKSDLRSS
jgi:hypothetical protein